MGGEDDSGGERGWLARLIGAIAWGFLKVAAQLDGQDEQT
jgi:hypothetical protein